jgi:putative PIN family toxin of toxin-antitoxin system
MTNVVLDTNVIVSAMFSEDSKPFAVVELAISSAIGLYYSRGIMDEYRAVLFRPKFNFGYNYIVSVLTAIESVGVSVAAVQSTIALPDETDRKFYDAAIAANALLITGNLRHYPTADFIISPAEFLTRFAPPNPL